MPRVRSPIDVQKRYKVVGRIIVALMGVAGILMCVSKMAVDPLLAGLGVAGSALLLAMSMWSGQIELNWGRKQRHGHGHRHRSN